MTAVDRSVTNTYPEPPSSICSTGPVTNVINGALLAIIRRHFAERSNIVVESLRDYIWDKDDKLSRILIEPIYHWKPTNIQQRPGVVIKRGAWKIQRMGIGDRVMATVSTDGYTEAEQQVLVVGSHSLFCLGRTGLEAEEVGLEVAMELMGFSEIIRQQLCLTRFQLDSIDRVFKVDECQDHFAVPVNITYGTQLNWKVLRQTPIWMRSSMSVLVE